jgi:hypothetical protein
MSATVRCDAPAPPRSRWLAAAGSRPSVATSAPLACSTLAEGGAAGEREAGGTDVKQWQAQMAYRAWRVEG